MLPRDISRIILLTAGMTFILLAKDIHVKSANKLVRPDVEPFYVADASFHRDHVQQCLKILWIIHMPRSIIAIS